MINLLRRNRICSTFISTPVNVRLALSPPRSPPFLSNKFLSNADRRSSTPKRRSPALSSRLPISRSGARHAKTSSYRVKNFRQAQSISIVRKSEFAVSTFSEVWILPGSSSRRSTGPVGYWTVQRGRRFAQVASFGYQSQITSHQSPLTAALAAKRYRLSSCGPLGPDQLLSGGGWIEALTPIMAFTRVQERISSSVASPVAHK
jgi:hypothetical protein